MAKQQAFGPWVKADPNTGGPIGAALASAGANMAAFNSTNAAPLRALTNFLRACAINANVALGSGSVTAEAQSAGYAFVRQATQTFGSLAAALPAYTASYTQAEFTATKTLLDQLRTGVINMGIGRAATALTATAAPATVYVKPRLETGGLLAAAANTQTSSYVQADVQTLLDEANSVRTAFINAGIASSADQADVITLTSDGGSTKIEAASISMLAASQDFAFDVLSIQDRNGTTKSATLAARSSNEDVATVVRSDNTNYIVTAVAPGECEIEVYGPTARTKLVIRVTRDVVPDAFELDDVEETIDVSDEDTFQLAWEVLNAAEEEIPEYAYASYFSFVSSDPTKATVDSEGLVTPLAAGSTTITVTLRVPLTIAGEPLLFEFEDEAVITVTA